MGLNASPRGIDCPLHPDTIRAMTTGFKGDFISSWMMFNDDKGLGYTRL